MTRFKKIRTVLTAQVCNLCPDWNCLSSKLKAGNEKLLDQHHLFLLNDFIHSFTLCHYPVKIKPAGNPA